jgi:hypothetical protein
VQYATHFQFALFAIGASQHRPLADAEPFGCMHFAAA